MATLTLLAELASALVPPLPSSWAVRWRPARDERAAPHAVARDAPVYPGLLATRSLSRWLLRDSKEYVLDPDLGWILGANQELHMRVGTRACTIHTDSHGARVGVPREPQARALLLLGCSVSLGWGVEDNEPFGRVVAERSGGRLFDVNLGVPSGGPHEVYALVSAARERALVSETGVAAAVLTLLPHHVLRVAGAYKNAGESPRFELVNGQLVRRGQHEVTLSNLIMLPGWWPFQRQLHKSIFLGRFWDAAVDAYALRLQEEIDRDPSYACDLTAELVRATTEAIAQRYGAPTLVLLTPEWESMRVHLKQALRARGVEPIDLAERLPELGQLVVAGDPDRHPSAEGHRRIAPVVEAWLEKSLVASQGSVRK